MTDTPQQQEEDQRAAEVVQDHLPGGFSAAFDGAYDSPDQTLSSTPDLTTPEGQSSLKLQGGDIHRDLYKINARAGMHQRSKTFGGVSFGDSQSTMPVSEQLVPGGFRRQFVQQKYGTLSPRDVPIARNFVDFLDLYGSFAGEDLAESEDESTQADVEEGEERERRPLLGRRKSTRRAPRGDAGLTRTFFTLLKAFIGTGIMFLPKAFQNGGILFSSVCLVTVAVVTTAAFHLLLKCREKHQLPGYGELGEAIAGRKMRTLILCSITISQLGFVCSGVIFVADNLKSFADAVAPGPDQSLSTRALIALQLLVLIPLALIRNISKLGPAAMLADVFILLGLTYIWYYDIHWISLHGVAKSVTQFNPSAYTLTVGASIFTFEGIGLILPIQSAMAQPQKFEHLLFIVMILITLIFSSVGVLCYMTFGVDTKIEVINNFPQDRPIVNAVQFVYALAILVGTPVQLFPAIRILEGKLLRNVSGKKSTWGKWKKNLFRTTLVLLCIAVSIAGAASLDRFVALIGSFACVPLVYIYPPLLHYKGVADSTAAKAGDAVLMAAGFFAMAYTTIITIATSFL